MILGKHHHDWRLLAAAPDDKLLQCPKRWQFAFQCGESFRRQIGSIDDFHAAQCRALPIRNQRAAFAGNDIAQQISSG